MSPHVPEHNLHDADSSPDAIRFGNFSDGVFSIAVTLLVFQFAVPDIAKDPKLDLFAQLFDQGGALVAYVFSFLMIGLIWNSHRRLMRDVATIDHPLMLLNLLVLGAVAFIPFPTSVVAAALGTPAERDALVFYTATLAATALILNLPWWYCARRPQVLVASFDHTAIRSLTLMFMAGPLVYLVALGLAFVSTTASMVALLVPLIVFAFPPPPTRVAAR